MKTLLLLPAVLVAATLPFGRPVTFDRPLGEHDWKVDAVHSSVVFKVKHANASWFQGGFDHVDGTVTLDPAHPEQGHVELKIPVESIDTNDEKRDGHLKGSDFFSAKENPEIHFVSSKIEAKGDTLHVTGKLSMAGHEETVTIPVVKVGEGEFYGPRVGWSAHFPITRSKFGMTYGLDKNALGDEVLMMIELELVKP